MNIRKRSEVAKQPFLDSIELNTVFTLWVLLINCKENAEAATEGVLLESNFAIFTEKHQRWSLFLIQDIAIFLRAPILEHIF